MNNNKTIERAKKYVNKLLVPLEKHYYHSYRHAIEVMERAIYLGEKEGLNESEIEMLGLAGLFHDTGFVIQYDDNEPIGAKIAKNFLKSILYPVEKINIIERIILATKPSYTNPKDIYERIIKDADLDNLGRKDFFQKGHNLKKEIEIIKNIKIRDPDWNHGSVDLLKEHHYQTLTQIIERDATKQENLKKMLTELENGKKVKKG
ncbi:MAG: HD domain-containing protein [Candidatus Gracilibacteria bacterium]|nr:HD domain-containing protein [Candidatus Gracilibacteria bacterium]